MADKQGIELKLRKNQRLSRWLEKAKGRIANVTTSQKYTYPSGNNGTFELALDVDTPEEVDKEYHKMVNKGATPIIEPKTYPWGLRSCYIADPEGNLIEIATWKNENA